MKFFHFTCVIQNYVFDGDRHVSLLVKTRYETEVQSVHQEDPADGGKGSYQANGFDQRLSHAWDRDLAGKHQSCIGVCPSKHQIWGRNVWLMINRDDLLRFC